MILPNWIMQKMGRGFGNCQFPFWNEKLLNLQHQPNYVGSECFVVVFNEK